MVSTTALLDQSVRERPALVVRTPSHLECLVVLALRPRLWFGSRATEEPAQELHVRRIGAKAQASFVNARAAHRRVPSDRDRASTGRDRCLCRLRETRCHRLDLDQERTAP